MKRYLGKTDHERILKFKLSSYKDKSLKIEVLHNPTWWSNAARLIASLSEIHQPSLAQQTQKYLGRPEELK